jgi:lipopolysaccharide biosynthesis glycosyltransferase
MEGFAAGFVFDERVCECGEVATYRELGLPDDGLIFNSGVVLMNVPQWKSEGRTKELLEFCKRKYKNGDQPALNFVFHGKAHKLARKFNVTLYPQVTGQLPAEGIFHFVGSPKPWDIAGDWLNPHAHIYYQGVNQTALPKFATSKYLQLGSYERAMRLMRSYYRIAKLRFDNRHAAPGLNQ